MRGDVPVLDSTGWVAFSGKGNQGGGSARVQSVDVRAGRIGPVPSHLRDAHYGGSKKLGHGVGYRYAHNEPFGVAEQQYAPDVVADATYYQPTSLGAEAAVKDRWERIRKVIRGGGR